MPVLPDAAEAVAISSHEAIPVLALVHHLVAIIRAVAVIALLIVVIIFRTLRAMTRVSVVAGGPTIPVADIARDIASAPVPVLLAVFTLIQSAAMILVFGAGKGKS